MDIVVGNGLAIRVQTLDEAVYILHRANTFGKGMSPTIIHPAIGVNSRADWLSNFGMVTSLGEGKLWIQTY